MNKANDRLVEVELVVNDKTWNGSLEPRLSLADFLREKLGLTGTHLGCEHGVCGACTVLVDGEPERACLSIAVATNGRRVTTIEGLSGAIPEALKEAFSKHHALQCGFCTPGMLITATDIINRGACLDEEHIRRELAGNLCRCTGYQGLVAAIGAVAKREVNHGDA
ncbi:(2Fe-2S)-binding protein [Bradyrhizobium liaoningense]